MNLKTQNNLYLFAEIRSFWKDIYRQSWHARDFQWLIFGRTCPVSLWNIRLPPLCAYSRRRNVGILFWRFLSKKDSIHRDLILAQILSCRQRQFPTILCGASSTATSYMPKLNQQQQDRWELSQETLSHATWLSRWIQLAAWSKESRWSKLDVLPLSPQQNQYAKQVAELGWHPLSWQRPAQLRWKRRQSPSMAQPSPNMDACVGPLGQIRHMICVYIYIIIYNYIQDKIYIYIYTYTYIYLPLLKHSEHLQTVNSHGAAWYLGAKEMKKQAGCPRPPCGNKEKHRSKLKTDKQTANSEADLLSPSSKPPHPEKREMTGILPAWQYQYQTKTKKSPLLDYQEQDSNLILWPQLKQNHCYWLSPTFFRAFGNISSKVSHIRAPRQRSPMPR